MAKANVPAIPSVLAFEKKLAPSDALFYGCMWDTRHTDCQGLKIQEKSVRGTISNRLKAALQKDPAKLDAEIEKANLQTVDVCSLPMSCDTLQVRFTLKVLSRIEEPSACNDDAFREQYSAAVEEYIARDGFTEIAHRYATNLANGRFLWRNRVGADSLEVRINVSETDAQMVFDAKEIGLRNMPHSSAKTLGDLIAETLCGRREYLLMHVCASVRLGAGQEVFPSQELITVKSDKKSKYLYEVDGNAAMHSQKIGNAIRTIDTWYEPGAATPIAVEVYGSVTSRGKAYRPPKGKLDFYSLFDRFATGHSIDADQQHFVMATLVRGGVFGQAASKED